MRVCKTARECVRLWNRVWDWESVCGSVWNCLSLCETVCACVSERERERENYVEGTPHEVYTRWVFSVATPTVERNDI